MVKVIGDVLPSQWVEFWGKVVRWYNLKGIPSYSRLWFQDYRRMRQIRYNISDFQAVGVAWQNLSPADKEAWRAAAKACWDYNRGYRLFTADYVWRLIAGLPVPGTPSIYHQLFGMQIHNPDGLLNVYMRRDDKDLVGQITAKVKFKKTENAASPTASFKISQTGWYFTQGGFSTDTDEHAVAAGDIAWNEVERTFGTASREYFHYKIVLSIENYNATVDIDSIELLDQNGRFFKENFITERNKAWVPALLYRKKDWIFSPGFSPDYFKHLYLE
jgi:hypothetical protein